MKHLPFAVSWAKPQLGPEIVHSAVDDCGCEGGAGDGARGGGGERRLPLPEPGCAPTRSMVVCEMRIAKTNRVVRLVVAEWLGAARSAVPEEPRS